MRVEVDLKVFPLSDILWSGMTEIVEHDTGEGTPWHGFPSNF